MSIINATIGLDAAINTAMVSIQTEFLTMLMIVITTIASFVGMALLSGATFCFLAYKNRWHNASLLAYGMLGGFLLEFFAKELFVRARPENALLQVTGYSFPSGHSTMAIIYFSLIIYFFKDEIKDRLCKGLFIAGNILLILLIGFSRLYLNVHWLSDVLAGYLLGIIWLTFIVLLFKQVKKAKILPKKNKAD